MDLPTLAESFATSMNVDTLNAAEENDDILYDDWEMLVGGLTPATRAVLITAIVGSLSPKDTNFLVVELADYMSPNAAQDFYKLAVKVTKLV